MKRNYPPESDDDLQNERQIIEDRLNQLFSFSQIRRVLHSNKGFWCEQRRHVILESKVNPHQYDGMAVISKDLGYNYLDPFEALYFLESRQLIIYFNELPLSLAEAYNLLLKCPAEFRDYVIFVQFNRCGHFCLKPKTTDRNLIAQSCSSDQPQSIGSTSTTDSDVSSCGPEDLTLEKPLFNITEDGTPLSQILSDLRAFGPSDEIKMGPAALDESIVLFEVYKRETFHKNKPRQGRLGNPDYLVINHDLSTTEPPIADLLVKQGSRSSKYIFTLIDVDGTICFTQFKMNL